MVLWFMYLVQNTRDIRIEYVYPEHADMTIGFKEDDDIVLAIDFYNKLSLSIFDPDLFFKDELLIRNEFGHPDYISTAIYLSNCIQEYNAEYKDKFGRFDEQQGLQKKFGVERKNYVVELIDCFLEQCGIKPVRTPSQICISHDIDFLTSGYKQEFLFALNSGDIRSAIRFTSERLKGGSPWDNIAELIKLDQSLGVNATFYWLNNNQPSEQGIANADYVLDSENLTRVNRAGLVNGLHKSVSKANVFREADDFPVRVIHNRFHYLAFNLPQAWQELEHKKSTIRTDSSLGFSRMIGFRNSYGLPFYPYNFYEERPFDTLIFPLNVMDVALKSHSSQDRHLVVKETMDFVLSNKEDALISLLFHNNELTPYSNKYMLDAYKDIIDIIHEEGLDIIGMDEAYEIFR